LTITFIKITLNKCNCQQPWFFYWDKPIKASTEAASGADWKFSLILVKYFKAASLSPKAKAVLPAFKKRGVVKSFY
jgi:hypothetical protein